MPSNAARRIRGEVIVGKDGYGITECGTNQQQIVRFSSNAQAAVDKHLEQGGAMQFFLDGWAVNEGRQLEINAVERIGGADTQCAQPGTPASP